MVDPQGKVTLAQSYTPFGNVLEQVGAGQSGFGYTGEQQDPLTQLIYLRARYYDPMTGRFLTKDPFPGLSTIPASLHPYAYAANNPLLYTDPSGEIAPLLLAMGIGAAIGGVGGGIGYAATHPGQDYFHSSGFYQAVGVGAASGAIAGGVGFGVGALFPAGGGFAYSVGAGMVSGAAASGAGQITANALTPCVEWNSGVGQAMIFGGFTGGLAGGAGYGIKRWMANRTIDPNKLYHIFENPTHDHKLDDLVNMFGGQKATYRAVYNKFAAVAGNYTNTQLGKGIPIVVGGQTVIVRGAIVNGAVRIGTFFIP